MSKTDVQVLKSDIIPVRPIYTGIPKGLNREAICVFSTIGFFLDQDTFYKDQRTVKSGSNYTVDSQGNVLEEKSWFQWHATPRDLSLKQVVTEFAELFETIINEQVADRKVILPLSGGLDSRTQAAALQALGKDVHAYSYSFEGGHNEAAYGKQIAEVCSYSFENWNVPAGYLWNNIEQLAKINGCYSEFTHPRQMAFVNRYAALGDVFSLGHWGDVLFDDMGVPDTISFDEQVKVILKKILKKGGIELGRALWKAWSLSGNFDEYLTERVRGLLASIDIQHSANARIRAFKSMYWAPRWTAINLRVFESVRPITLPYFDNRICQFICTIPEKHLAKRKIQIEYLKLRAPKLAQISWQEHRPFNLNNYQWDKAPYNWPYRAINKLMRSLSSQEPIQRNWELQFAGEQNDKKLNDYLFDNPAFSEFIPKEVTQQFYSDFKQVDPVRYSHSVSMLLTLALHTKLNVNTLNTV